LHDHAAHQSLGEIAMSLPHAGSGALINVRPLGNRLKESVSTALVKTANLEVMRLVLLSGKAMPEHKLAGEVTIQCIEGVIELHAHQKTQILLAGDMVYLASGEPHALQAREDASVLMTVLLRHAEHG
jgi:quercetin dioxygenase-like cupin family protein